MKVRDEGQPVLVAAVYPSREGADAGLADLVERAEGGLASVKDSAVVTLGADGRAEIAETHEVSVGEGVVAGGTVGLVVGILLGFPVAGALIGSRQGQPERDEPIRQRRDDRRLRAHAGEGKHPRQADLDDARSEIRCTSHSARNETASKTIASAIQAGRSRAQPAPP